MLSQDFIVGKQLFFEREGVYYFVDTHKYYVHHQHMIIEIKNKQTNSMVPTQYMKMFVEMYADPDVRKYYLSEQKKLRVDKK